jgi:Chaperone of endosialidase
LGFQPLDADLSSIAAYNGTGTWLYRSAVDTWSAVTIGSGLTFTSGTLTATGASSGVAEYTFSTDTSPPPASGEVQFNNATFSAVTTVWIHNITNNGTDLKRQFETIPIGATIIVQDQGNSANYAKYTVASAPVDNTDYFAFPVTHVASAGSISNNSRAAVVVQRESAYQPLDADLTALAALTGTNTIYYRSGADTWSPVTMGANMTFSGGVLDSTAAGGGGIPEPASDGFYGRNMASGVGSWVAAVKLAGDTMTGNLTISKNTPALILNTSASAQANQIGGKTNGSDRWLMMLGDAAPESGSNAGSDFAIVRYSDAGSQIDTPFKITRGNGAMKLAGDTTIEKSSPILTLRKSASGQVNEIRGQTGVNRRWQITLGNATAEVGSNNGSDFSITRFTDADVAVDTPLFIHRGGGYMTLGRLANGNLDGTTRAAQFSFRYNDWGIIGRNNDSGTHSAIVWLNSGGGVVGSADTSTTGTAWNTSSDRRLKKDFVPFMRGREILAQLRVQDFTWKETGLRETGLIAQDVEPYFPAAVGVGRGEPDDPDFMPYRIDNSRLVPVLIQALQEAFQEIETLKAQLARA